MISPHLKELQLDYSVLQVNGRDPENFLQGQLSCDLKKLSDQQILVGAFCSLKGRVITLLYVIQFQQQIFLIVPSALTDKLMTDLNKVALLSRVQIKDVTQEYYLFGLVKPDKTFLNRFVFQSEGKFATASLEDTLVIRMSCSQRRYLFMVKNIKISEFADEKFCDQLAWKYAEIADGFPVIHLKNSEIFTPEELNLSEWNAVSYDKGCYRGQEVIARMHFLGKKSYRMFVAKSENDFADLETILDNDEHLAGQIVCSAKIVGQPALSLASIKNFSADKQYFVQQKPLEILSV